MGNRLRNAGLLPKGNACRLASRGGGMGLLTDLGRSRKLLVRSGTVGAGQAGAGEARNV